MFFEGQLSGRTDTVFIVAAPPKENVAATRLALYLGSMLPALPLSATAPEREAHYREISTRIDSLLQGESNWIAALATVACELHHAFEYFDWTGFYRNIAEELVIGPYQGSHGCLRIAFSRGVCGAAARTRQTLLVPNVHAFSDHIACSSATESEIVVPVLTPRGALLAVLDVDSNTPNAFSEDDQRGLESICNKLGSAFAEATHLQ